MLTRHEDRVWARTRGSGPCDPVAIGRICRALTETQARISPHGFRFTTAADRAAHGPSSPDYEVEISASSRAPKAPRAWRSPTNAGHRDSRTSAYDGIQDESGAWWLVDIEGGVSYQVDRELIDLLRAPLQSDTILPLVPGLVRQLVFTRGASAGAQPARAKGRWWKLARRAACLLREPADPVQVRRYLSALAALTAVSRQPAAPLILPTAAALTVTVAMPASQGEEHLTLTLSDPNRGDGAGQAAASVTSSTRGAEVPRGQVCVDRAAAVDLMAVSRDRFALGTTRAPRAPVAAPPQQ